MEPNVRLLRYFLAIADAGTFTEAAGILHVSQPALSQQIKKLEGELGFSLFQRGTRRVTLTPRGRDLISSARQVTEAAESYRSRARNLAGGTQELTIGYRAAHEATRAVVDAFRAERPDVAVRLRHYPIAATHAGLDVGEVDLAVLRLPIVVTGLRTLTLYTEPRIALLPAGHALASQTRIRLADLAGLPWITTAAQDPVLAGARATQRPARQAGHRCRGHTRRVPRGRYSWPGGGSCSSIRIAPIRAARRGVHRSRRRRAIRRSSGLAPRNPGRQPDRRRIHPDSMPVRPPPATAKLNRPQATDGPAQR